MRISHYTCDSRSILTRTCRKPKPVAFALHLSAGASATYSRVAGKLFRAPSEGLYEALVIGWSIGICRSSPGTCLRSPHLRPCREPRAPAAYVPPISPVYNWGGVYFGFNLGYGFGTSKWTDPHEPPGSTGNFNLRGFVVGPTIGINFQTDSFVYSAEADFDGSWIDGKNSSQFCPNPCETKSFWNSTLRARLGMRRIEFCSTALAVARLAISPLA